jgi:hypothetical protein
MRSINISAAVCWVYGQDEGSKQLIQNSYGQIFDKSPFGISKDRYEIGE